MTPTSLKFRLLLFAVGTTFVALLLAGMGIAALFNAHAENRIAADLGAQFDRLVAMVEPDNDPIAPDAPLADPAYATPFGGRYWQITDPMTGARLRSRSMWDVEFDQTDPAWLDGQQHIVRLIDPEGAPAIAIVRRFTFSRADGTGLELDMIVAEDLDQLAAANREFQGELVRSLAVLAAFLIIAAWLQFTLGLAPLSTIQKQVNAVRAGLARRLAGRFPREVTPLVNEVNDLLDGQEQSIAFARDRAADLAHGLKTSLTVLNAHAAELRGEGGGERADAIEKLTAEMTATIDHQLRLVRLGTRLPTSHFATPLAPLLAQIVGTLKNTPAGERLTWTINGADDLSVDIDRPDLIELIGIVLENAAQWAKTRVDIAVVAGTETTVTVTDDGPGLGHDQIARIGKRGVRLDRKGTGTGIGLAIALEIAAMNSGSVTFATAKHGGLIVAIGLKPAPTRPAPSR